MTANTHEWSAAVYGPDDAEIKDKAHGWIQWKGTVVCMDVHCKCGEHGHIDESFAYFYVCLGCGAKYAMSPNVRMIELTGDLLRHAEANVHPSTWKSDPRTAGVDEVKAQ